MWSVIQVLETGEEVCAGQFRAKPHAVFWIEENRDNYPESSFYVDKGPMNATNLGSQPEHEILFRRDELQNAAFEYGRTAGALQEVLSCGLPGSFANKFSAEFLEAKNNLELAALAYFNNVYDGGEL